MPFRNLSVFFPLYNEEGNVKNSVEKAIKVLETLKIDYEILLINDGSKDDTGKIADNLVKENPKIRAIHHQQNLGYGEALKSGFYNSKYDTIVYTDGDGQFDFSEINKFLEKIEGHDLVIGYRIKRQDPLFRILFKQGWQLSLLLFFGLTLKDVDCGFKMLRKKVLEKIPHLESSRGAMINAEITIKAKKYGFRVGQVGVNHYPRLSGKPTGASIPVIIRSYLDLLSLWWQLKDRKYLFILLIVLLLLAAFLRFYRLEEYMTFLGDEGRDALIVKDILTGQNFPLIGPPTSVGNIYLGPLYYYMMASSMIFTLNPVFAAGMNAIIGVLTVLLIYYLGKVWFGRVAGLVASFLYAISPVAIIYSRSSWNPNPAPFFALLGIFSLYRLNKSGNFLWLILTGIFLASSLQMHYLAIILIPVVILLYIHELWSRKFKKLPLKNLYSGTFGAILAFLALMSPLFIFDLKHDFLNYKAITALFSEGSAVKADIFSNILRIPQLYSNSLIGRYTGGENFLLTVLVSVLVIIPIINFFYLKEKKKVINWPIMALTIWLLVGLLGLSFYQQDIYDHYFGFLNPVPFLLFGSLLSMNIPYKRFFYGGILLLVLLIAWINLENNPLKNPPNNQLKRTQEISKFVIQQASGRPFNFALLAERNYDSAYQFYLDKYGYKPKMLPFEKTDQLFVVCEDAICNPTVSPKHEIAAFGWTLVEKEWKVLGLKVYKLVHNPEEDKQTP